MQCILVYKDEFILHVFSFNSRTKTNPIIQHQQLNDSTCNAHPLKIISSQARANNNDNDNYYVDNSNNNNNNYKDDDYNDRSEFQYKSLGTIIAITLILNQHTNQFKLKQMLLFYN